MMWSSAHVSMAWVDFEDQVLSGLGCGGACEKEAVGGPARNGALLRSGGLGQIQPKSLDCKTRIRPGWLAGASLISATSRARVGGRGGVGLGALGCALLFVERVRGGVDRCFHQPPALLSGAIPGGSSHGHEISRRLGFTRGHRPGYPVEGVRRRCREAADVADLGGDGGGRSPGRSPGRSSTTGYSGDRRQSASPAGAFDLRGIRG